VLADSFEDVAGVGEQGAFDEGECAGFFEWDDDGDVFLLEGEAGFAPLDFFDEVAVEDNSAEFVDYFLPFLYVENFHRPSIFLVQTDCLCSQLIVTRGPGEKELLPQEWPQLLGVASHVGEDVVSLLPAALLPVLIRLDREEIRVIGCPFEDGGPSLFYRSDGEAQFVAEFFVGLAFEGGEQKFLLAAS
jgi:hypothetical protein